MLNALLASDAPVRFVSFEPLLNDVGYLNLDGVDCYLNLDGVDWVIIGAQTGPKSKQPNPEWFESILDQCDSSGIPVFLKDNLTGFPRRQEFPAAALVAN